jgi:hypothetical protein
MSDIRNIGPTTRQQRAAYAQLQVGDRITLDRAARGTQLAAVVHRAATGQVYVRKWIASKKVWTGRVPLHPSQMA